MSKQINLNGAESQYLGNDIRGSSQPVALKLSKNGFRERSRFMNAYNRPCSLAVNQIF